MASSNQHRGLRARLRGFFCRMPKPSGQGGLPDDHPQENSSCAAETHPGQSDNPSLAPHSQKHTPDLGVKKEKIDTPPESRYKPLYPVLTGGYMNHHANVPPNDQMEPSVQQLLNDLESKDQERNMENHTFERSDKWEQRNKKISEILSADLMNFQVHLQEQYSEMQREQENEKSSMKMEMDKISEQLDSERKKWSEERNRMKREFEMERERMQLELKKTLEGVETAQSLQCDQAKEENIEKCQNLKTCVQSTDHCVTNPLPEDAEVGVPEMETSETFAEVDTSKEEEDTEDEQSQVVQTTLEKPREEAEQKERVTGVTEGSGYQTECYC